MHALSHASLGIGACVTVVLGQGETGPDTDGRAPADLAGSGVMEARREEMSGVGRYGPHSPWGSPQEAGHDMLASDLGQAREAMADQEEGQARDVLADREETEELSDEAADPLGVFLISCSSPPPTALLPIPSANGGGNTEGQVERPTKRSSGRLAAKPTVG